MRNDVAAVLAEAVRYLGEEEKPRGSNRSTRIDYWLVEAGAGLGLPWCAAFVGQVGRQALGTGWPVPRSASVSAISAWAEREQLLVAAPHVGDLFLLWNGTLGRYAHIGFVESLKYEAAEEPTTRIAEVVTLEGNTNSGGSREGFGVFRRERRPGTGLMFVRWASALGGGAIPEGR